MKTFRVLRAMGSFTEYVFECGQRKGRGCSAFRGAHLAHSGVLSA